MLFQTLVQLNILILATPALAGWSLLPPVHGAAVHAVCIVRHRTETAPNVAATTEIRQAKHVVLAVATAPLTTASAKLPNTVFASLSILPYAARAP